MTTNHFFITGALGCIGAWVVRELLAGGFELTLFDMSVDTHRLRLVVRPKHQGKWTLIQGDITDSEAVATAVRESGAGHIIHLAALQVPFCKADPALGAAVNVVGTVNIFEAAKRAGIGQVTYASSLAVYGRKEDYPPGLLAHDAPLNPLNLYGVFKQANEGTAQIYWQDDAIASVGLRPYTVYGPGRDQGMTSTPTKAMLAAARGEHYHISYGGSNGFQYAADVARIFIKAAQAPVAGSAVYNLRGSVAHMRELVYAIVRAEPNAAGKITFEEKPLPFPDGQDEEALAGLLGEIPYTPLQQGVAQTIAHFKEAIAAGQL